VKATFVLFPLLGINNLLFLYNPGGDFNKYFVTCNTFFGSTQGIFVSVLYCFVCKDVRAAIQRSYQRFLARRSTNSLGQRCSSPRENGNSVVNGNGNGGDMLMVGITITNSCGRPTTPVLTKLEINGKQLIEGAEGGSQEAHL